MVVIVLIAVFSAMIVPELRGSYEDALLRSTGRKLIAAFSLASSRAVSLNKIHRVRLGGDRYLIEERLGAGRTGDEFGPVRGVPDAEGELDRRVTIRSRGPVSSMASGGETLGSQESPEKPLLHYDNAVSGGDSSSSLAAPKLSEGGSSKPTIITFFPDGTAEEQEILLRDRSGSELTLRVNPITAQVHVVETPRRE